VTWWCSAQGAPWDWSWQAYPGVWVLLLLLLVGYVVARRRVKRSGLTAEDLRPRTASYLLGMLTLWIAADWPVGPLGAGYLVSVHTVQYLLFTMVIPPLLLFGLHPTTLRAMLRHRAVSRVAWIVTRPLIAFVIFNTVLVATHMPSFVDAVKVTQIGSFAVDMAWLAAGLLFWWQVLGPLPELRPLGYPGRILFLLANVFIPTVPASFLTFADYPLYVVYELAPRVSGLSAVQDQQIAGLTMKIGGGLLIFGTASVLFFRWDLRAERQDEAAPAVRPVEEQVGV
jgi:putative membrane protein